MASSMPEEIKKSIRNGLSLECDAKLLQYMELISNRLINRAKTTSKNLDTMSSELQRTSISLDNVTNNLSSLSHTKFIENRVYDDDETIANIKEVPVEIKTKEYNPIKTLNTVIKNNMKMLDNCYEKVSLELDDSDEEDEQIKSIVYRPKNKFETRPIPHLIGTKEWKENWHIGIYDSDESFSENDNEEFSDGSDSLSLPSNGPTISESGSSLWSINHNNNKSKLPNKKIDYTSSDEEISTTSKTSSNDIKQRNLPQIPSVVHEQKFYVHQPKKYGKGLFDESSESEDENKNMYAKENKDSVVPEPLPRKSQQQQPVKSNKISNIFIDEPPEFDVNVQQKQKNTSKLFFDSDEDELFKQKENSAQIPIPQPDNVRKKTVNLFDDDDFNSFMKELDQKTNEKASKDANRNINLFEDQSEKIQEVTDKQNRLFDCPTASDIKSNINNNKIVQSVPDSEKIENNVHTNLFQDEDEFLSSTVEPINKLLEKSTVIKNTAKTNFANLFDDTPPDDEFDNLFKSSSRMAKESSKIEQNLNSNTTVLPNTDNYESVSQILNTSTNINKNIFNNDTEEEIEQANSPDDFLETTNKNEHNEVLFEVQSSRESSSTFVQSSEQKNISNQENFVSANLFGDITVEKSENIFNNNVDVINNGKEKEIKNLLSDNFITSSLFDDVPEDDDDFFKSLSNTQKNKKVSEKSIKVVENDIMDCILETPQNKTNQNDLFDYQTNEALKKVEVLHDEESVKLIRNDKLPDLLIDNTPLNDENFLEKSNNENSDENIVENLNNRDLLSSNTNSPNDSNVFNYSESVGQFENLLKSNNKIEAENIPNVNDSNTEISKFSDNFLNKSTIHSVFMPTIFDDTPPDDDDDIFSSSNKNNFNEGEIFEASADNYNFNKTQNVSNMINYDSVVFQDTTPPDDNNDVNTSVNNEKNDEFTTKITIDNTVADSTKQITESKSNFLFDTEPPTENFDKMDKKIDSKESELFEEKSLSVSDLIRKASTANKENDTRNSNSKPSLGSRKLSTNLNINVAALLPGAKRSIVANVNKDESDGNISTKNQTLNLDENSKMDLNKKNSESKEPNIDKKSTEKQSEHNILISLNKNRVPIPKRRRPSTKEGRLENYRKSLAEIENEKHTEEIKNSMKNAEIIGDNKLANTKIVEKEVIKNISNQNSNSLFSDEFDNDNSWLTKSINNQEILKNKNEQIFQSTTENVSSIKKSLSSPLSSIKQSEVQSKKDSPFSFTDSNDDNSDDWLFKATSKSNSEAKAQNKNVGDLSKNLGGVESTFNPAISIYNKEIIRKSNSSTLIPNQTELKSKAESEEDNNVDSLFKTNLTEKNVFDSVIKSQTKKVNDPLLFHDENDLFSENSRLTATKYEICNKNLTENNTKSTEKLPNSENEIFKKIKIYKKKPTQNDPNANDDKIERVTKPSEKFQDKSSGLFDSDDNEPVSVNTTIEKVTKSPEKLQNKSKGLFDSEDDDDDDLFGNSSALKKLTVIKNTSSLEANKKNLNVSKRNNLFDDDDDDDDDLFGTKINKAQTAVTKKNVEKPKIIQSHGESTDYNPLADLLNDK